MYYYFFLLISDLRLTLPPPPPSERDLPADLMDDDGSNSTLTGAGGIVFGGRRGEREFNETYSVEGKIRCLYMSCPVTASVPSSAKLLSKLTLFEGHKMVTLAGTDVSF